jgi:DnaJ-class molecular chaperone with C-terminal Zn finger domain
MTSLNKLEIKGNLRQNAFADLLTEAAEARLDGSFRLSNQDRKAIIYLRAGEVVFAVSNAREHRLFEILLRENVLTQAQITEIPNFTNDLELSQKLVERKILDSAEIRKRFTQQIELIFKSVLAWGEGEWIFSPLARVKDSIDYKIETPKILLEYARNLSPNDIVRRFRSFQESFGVKPKTESHEHLAPLEAFILSRFDKPFLKVDEIVALGGISESLTMKTLYALWLGGFLYRRNFNAAFTEHKIAAIHSAKLSLKTSEAKTESAETKTAKPAAPVKQVSPPAEKPVEKTSAVDENLQLEDYLRRVEEAETLYEVLGVAPKASAQEIKNAYLMLAKRFHPDRFHKEAGSETHRRVQSAFTEIAHAYEILKDEKSREVYDFKNREKINSARTEKTRAPKDEKENARDIAEATFREGYDLLVNEEYEEALPLLARAVHYAPNNARYRAFYGKLLSLDEKSRYKAESELQQAVKLDSSDPLYRLMLAEFYIDYGLYRRAEGELQRLLNIFPNNPEALELLQNLPKK